MDRGTEDTHPFYTRRNQMCSNDIYINDKLIHIIPRKKAKEIGLQFYFTGKPCKYGHISERYVRNGLCVHCDREYKSENKERIYNYKMKWHQKHREQELERMRRSYRECREDRLKYGRQRYKENKEHISDQRKKYYRENKERISEYHRKYYEDNKEYILSQVSEYRDRNKPYVNERQREWKKVNRDKVAATVAKRRARKLQRTLELSPYHQSETLHIYEQAALLRHLGYDVQVDHIIPLQGKIVSGLHVPWNLQIISSEDNIRKGNKFESYIEVY